MCTALRLANLQKRGTTLRYEEKEIIVYNTVRAVEEAQAEVNRTNNVKVKMLEDSGSLYHYAELTVKHSVISDVTIDLLKIVKKDMKRKYKNRDIKLKIKSREIIDGKLIVVVAMLKITGDVRIGLREYKKSITKAKIKMNLDTANTQRKKENKNG